MTRCILAKWFRACTVVIVSHLAICGVLGDNEVAGSAAPQSFSLEQLLASTAQRNGQIQEALAEVEVARAQLGQANAAWMPRASAMVLGAPIFEERGDAQRSQANWSHWGPFITTGVQVVQPLHTFGQISNYQKAAQNQIVAKEKLALTKRSEIILTAKEMYYSYLMATDLHNLLDKLMKFLKEAINTSEKSMNEEKSSMKPHDLFRLKSAYDDLEQKKLHARQAKSTAERAVLWITQAQASGISTVELSPEKFEKRSLEDYLAVAKTSRPEFEALNAGLEAKTALRDAKQAQSYPVLFLGGFANYGWSPVRDKQPSVFANDPFNQFTGGLGLGLKFDLEFARHRAEAAEQEGEYLKLKATQSYAVPGIELQVKKAFWELEQAMDSLEVAKRRRDTTKKWFVSSSMGWSIGITPAKDLMEALEGDGLAKKNYVETVFAYNMAIARLSQTIGKEITSMMY